MAEQESAAARNANKHFRKEAKAREGALAWQEIHELENAMRLKTARLRAQRLARDVATASVPLRKSTSRANSTKR
jgi:hypothetical protein